MNLTKRTQRVREEALGFDACGFAKAGRLEMHSKHFRFQTAEKMSKY